MRVMGSGAEEPEGGSGTGRFVKTAGCATAVFIPAPGGIFRGAVSGIF